MTIGLHHSMVVDELNALNEFLRPHGCYMRTQHPIAVPPGGEPEPDGAIVRGVPRTYAQSRPTAADVLCVFEVSETSIINDRTVKQRLYAAAGIKQYIIVNLRDREIELRTDPVPAQSRYANTQILSGTQLVSIPTADGVGIQIAAEKLLP